MTSRPKEASLAQSSTGPHATTSGVHETLAPPSDGAMENERSTVDLSSGTGELRIVRREKSKKKLVAETAEKKALERMNAKHAVVREGGKTIVITEEIDPVLGRVVLSRSSFLDIRNFHANEFVMVKKAGKGDPTPTPLGDWWLKHPERRQYDGVAFHPGKETPGYFNLWRGWPIAPKPGDWSLMHNHLRDVICSGNEEHFQYVLAWMAAAVQHPDVPAEVALVLRGRRGTGKGIFGREFSYLFGQHTVHVADSKHLVGNFNAHLQDAILVFADEAFEAGDRRAEAVLKMIIADFKDSSLRRESVARIRGHGTGVSRR